MSNEDIIFGIILVLGAVSAFYLSFPLQRYLDKTIYGEDYVRIGNYVFKKSELNAAIYGEDYVIICDYVFNRSQVDAAIKQFLLRNENAGINDPALQAAIKQFLLRNKDAGINDPALQALLDSNSTKLKLEELANEAKFAASTKKNWWDLAMPDCNNFYDPENLEFEAVQILNEHILFILIQFIFVFCWLALNVLTHYRRWVFKWQETLLGGFVSTSLVDQNPQIILCSILPSFLDVLYFFEDHYVPKIAVKAIGHQWSLERLHNPIGPTEGGISFLCSSIQNDPCSSG